MTRSCHYDAGEGHCRPISRYINAKRLILQMGTEKEKMKIALKLGGGGGNKMSQMPPTSWCWQISQVWLPPQLQHQMMMWGEKASPPSAKRRFNQMQTFYSLQMNQLIHCPSILPVSRGGGGSGRWLDWPIRPIICLSALGEIIGQKGLICWWLDALKQSSSDDWFLGSQDVIGQQVH